MNAHRRKFRNEIGNEIEIRVSEKDIDRVRGVLLWIAGPNSDTEMHITRLEAEVLHEELGKALKGE